MRTSDVVHVKKAKKLYLCDWCNEAINIGSEYDKYFCFDEPATVRMHPECYSAMLRADLYDEELPPRGTFKRGAETCE